MILSEEEMRSYLRRRRADHRLRDSGYYEDSRLNNPEKWVECIVPEWQVGDRWLKLKDAYRAQVELDLHAMLTERAEARP